MVLCKCDENNDKFGDNCKDCGNLCQGGTHECIDDKTLGMATNIFITLMVLSYVFFLLLIYFVIKTLDRCKGKPKWLSPLLLTLVILVLILGWVPILNIILVIALLVVMMHFYTSCGKKK